MSNLMLDVDQAGELKAAFRRGNWTNQEIKALCEGDVLAQVRQVVLGRAAIGAVRHVIDGDADPFIPNGWKVEHHQKTGEFIWDSSQVKLYLSPNQMGGKVIQGHKLRKELADQPVFNANLLDYALKHQGLIPEEWKGKAIFFWGTIYSDGDGDLCVRCLNWYGGQWYDSCYWLDLGFDDRNPAAVRAS